jgi:ABC-type amino acid transport substrate-binding protein
VSARPIIRLVLVAVAVGVVAVASACGGDDGDSGGDGKTTANSPGFETLKSGTLQVGMDIPFPPFHYGKAPDYQGFDVDLSREVARRLGLDLEIVRRPFETLIRDLTQSRYDLVFAATTVTPEREKVVDFSKPYFRADQSLVVAADSPIKSEDDLSDKVVGVQLGTSAADYVKANVDAGSVRTFDTVDDAFNALNTGQVDAVVNDLPTSQAAVEKKPGIKIAKRLPTEEVYAVAFRKGSEDMRAAIEHTLATMVKDGFFEKTYRKWFDSEPPAEITSGLAG